MMKLAKETPGPLNEQGRAICVAVKDLHEANKCHTEFENGMLVQRLLLAKWRLS
jgi:hypothetical protein